MTNVILAIDPGSEKSGIILMVEGEISEAGNIPNEEMFLLVDNYTMFRKEYNFSVVYEDIRPFTSRFNMDTINTIKMIGRLEYVLKSKLVSFRGITRNEVKSYYFEKHKSAVWGDIEKKIAKKGRVKKNGEPVSPSFTYMDDRTVGKCVRLEFNIPAGQKNKYKIKAHAWQALAVLGKYLSYT